MKISSYSLFGSNEKSTRKILAKYIHFSQQAIAFNHVLAAHNWQKLLAIPAEYDIMNPFQNGDDNGIEKLSIPAALQISSDFYEKFYADSKPRYLILGINPGRKGAGLTGVPFTDSERLQIQCQVATRGVQTYEMSAEYIYKLIDILGGPQAFYSKFYINSPLPLGLLQHKTTGTSVNANYYDAKSIQNSVLPMINMTMNSFKQMNITNKTVFVLGNSKNYQFVSQWNTEHKFFKQVVPLPHPRYVMQYKRKELSDILQRSAEQIMLAS